MDEVDEYLDCPAFLEEHSLLDEFLDDLPSSPVLSERRETIEASERAHMRSMCNTFRANPFTFQLSEGGVGQRQETETATPHSEPPLLYNFWLDGSQPPIQEAPPNAWRRKLRLKRSSRSTSDTECSSPIVVPPKRSNTRSQCEGLEFNRRSRRLDIDPRQVKTERGNSPPDQPGTDVPHSAGQTPMPSPLHPVSLSSLLFPTYIAAPVPGGTPIIAYPESPATSLSLHRGHIPPPPSSSEHPAWPGTGNTVHRILSQSPASESFQHTFYPPDRRLNPSTVSHWPHSRIAPSASSELIPSHPPLPSYHYRLTEDLVYQQLGYDEAPDLGWV
ncbi:uncharacterized protein EI90DRAFT_3058009 [Cantharellus anzutake]|uniref:uncharacterized protein n=1 Tax=Cantharellus anzutake TaxID=1750568 RepID=UPI0019065BAF|nr:uncharacterized protein EI90DRAFT_3058009 [Cantharellus anzutake]KAF8331465.1 hypothetical protein EI90DRAFT_3058009 [Cantharellus anzutake]